MPLNNDPAQYDAYYFSHCCGEPYERTPVWLNFFNSIADIIVRRINPQTVLDVGCAMGFLVEGLRDRSVDAYGIDLADYAIQRVRPDLKPFCAVGSILDPLPRRYDLIVSIEVLEHIPSQFAEIAVQNLCAATDDIIFSSTPFDYREPSHLNVRSPDYWSEIFAINGFVRDTDFDASFITSWAARFRKNQEPSHRIVRQFERQIWNLAQENRELRTANLEMRDQLANKESQSSKEVQPLQKKLTDLEREYSQIHAQSDQARQTLESQLNEQAQTIARLESQIAELMNSRGWRIMKKLQGARLALAPHNSNRERWFNKAAKLFGL